MTEPGAAPVPAGSVSAPAAAAPASARLGHVRGQVTGLAINPSPRRFKCVPRMRSSHVVEGST